MTRATLATRAAVGLSAVLMSAMSLAACGGDESGADETADETSELAEESADDPEAGADESDKRRDRERPATRDERRREPADQEEPASNASQTPEESETQGPATMSAAEFCERYTRYETKGVFTEADTPAGAQRAADRLDRLATRAPGAVQEDILLMARLFAEIAEANGDEDKLAEIDASELPATQKHLERWQKKHC